MEPVNHQESSLTPKFLFDNLGSSVKTNLFYTYNGTLGGTGQDGNNNAGFRIAQAFGQGASPQEALEAARAGLDAFRGAEDQDGIRSK